MLYISTWMLQGGIHVYHGLAEIRVLEKQMEILRFILNRTSYCSPFTNFTLTVKGFT